MSAPPFLTSSLLEGPGAAHGFFSRMGGVSSAPFASLNTGLGTDDHADDVAENRRRCADALGVSARHLLTCYQIHSPDVITVSAPWKSTPANADGLVTNTPGLALGVLAADCMPWLFIDPEANIIGAAHGGWRGALAGVLENTIAAMARLGAEPQRIKAGLGPCLHQPNFEVGLDLLETFSAKYPQSVQFFAPGVTDEKRQLDLAGFGAWRLRESGVQEIDDLKICTLVSPDRYFSYRAVKRDGGNDYGRNLSAIALV